MIYRLLGFALDALGIDATLNFGGVEITARIAVEENDVDGLAAPFAAARRVLVFSVELDALTDGAGNVVFPSEGDRVRFEVDGRDVEYRVVRDAATSRFWDWRYGRPGERIKFYAQRFDDKRGIGAPKRYG